MTTSSQLMGPHTPLLIGWTDLWNGHLDRAREICADRVTVRFGGRAIGADGDRITDPAGVARLIGAFRLPRPGLTYSIVEARTTDGWGHCLWDAVLGDLHVGGIDTFVFEGGRIARVHSVTGERSMRS